VARVHRWGRLTAAIALLAGSVPPALAAQDTTRARSAPTRVASGGEVAVMAYNAPLGDTAITRLERFLTQYPQSALRPRALFQLGELLVRRADERFAESQRAASAAPGDNAARPDYREATARYEELTSAYPAFERRAEAAYTLGTLYAQQQRYTDAVRMFEMVAADSSAFQGEALFRLGDAYFELASAERGEPRRANFARAATAYERATTAAPRDGDIYFLSLYKLGWSYYNQATQTAQAEYAKAVDVFGRLIDAYDRLTPEQQARLGLRGEAIEYMAIAFTQVGGADAANRYFASHPGTAYRLPVVRRVAGSLEEQGDFARAVEAYRAVIAQAPTDSGALTAQRAIVDLYQNRSLEPERAQEARLELVNRFGPGTPWAQANATGVVADSGAAIREIALRQAAQYALAQAQQRGDRQRYSAAASLYERYLREFPSADSAQAANGYLAEALFSTGDYARAGVEYSRTAYGPGSDSATEFAEQAGRNAIVAFDSALARNPRDTAAQDSLFATVDRFVERFPRSDIARTALMQKGRRASEAKRWDVMAATFRAFAQRFPNDSFAPNAQRLVGDALYRRGSYAEAQAQWETAQAAARQAGRGALADSIATMRTSAAASFADTLIRGGHYDRAAEEVYVALAEKNPGSEKAPDALRDAIETYMLADSAARQRGDTAASRTARERAIALAERLTTQYPRYQYRAQYQSLRARLLAETGKREEAVTALQALAAENPTWNGRADAMVRLASSLDTLGRKREAAAAYEAFATAYPTDRRAADAQYNAAITYLEAADSTGAARAYGTFATRFATDSRAAQARTARLAVLRATGDSATVERELASLCASSPGADLRATCSARVGERELRAGIAMFPAYQAERLVIPSKAQLTAAGVQRASARKQRMLREMTDHFTKAIESGSPLHLAAASYYVGLAQWEYGNFVKNVELPAGLTDAERSTATSGSERQAAQYYDAARKTWQSLLDKAQLDRFDNEWVARARDAIAGNVPAAPPAPGGSPP